MQTSLIVALIAGAVSLLTAAGTIWNAARNTERANANARAIEQLKIENDRRKAAEQRQQEIAGFSEPLARAAYDLQSRLYNILKQNFITAYLSHGGARERAYAGDNTAFLCGQYLCWTELVRREIQFIDLGVEAKTRDLLRLQDSIYSLWGTDSMPPPLRLFAGEQRALGEALIQPGATGPECMGYGAFLKAFPPGADPLVDALRADVLALQPGIAPAAPRLTALQHALVDLLDRLDPSALRFPRDRRTKV